MMELWSKDNLPEIGNIKLAVVGHVEWVTFISVDKLPQPGIISHSNHFIEEPAGGGAVAAVKMSKIIKRPVHFFTTLGNDSIGQKSHKRLKELGLKLSVNWVDKPTRRGISLVDKNGERAITVIGERLEPSANDDLPWDDLSSYDGIFISAADAKSIKKCRKAKFLVATPRIGQEVLSEANVPIDALVGSALDPDEQIKNEHLKSLAKNIIETKGELGGKIYPGGDFKSVKLNSKPIDAYGCGDSFVAGVTTGLAANWNIEKAISLGVHNGAECATHFGPYLTNDINKLE